MSFHEIPVIIVIYDAGGRRKTWPFLSFYPLILNFVHSRRSRSDPTKRALKVSPPNWLSCAPILQTASWKVGSWKSIAIETSTWSSRWKGEQSAAAALSEPRFLNVVYPLQKTRYGTYVMLLRAKIQSGAEDLAAFESHLLEENGLQRSHSSPTLADSSQVSQASSTLDGGNSSRASGGSGSKLRQEGQRHSYRQAVKKWDRRSGWEGTAWRCPSTCRGFSFEIQEGLELRFQRGQGRRSAPRPPPGAPTRHLNLLIWQRRVGRLQPAWRRRKDELGVDGPARPLRFFWARVQRTQTGTSRVLFSSLCPPSLLPRLGPKAF